MAGEDTQVKSSEGRLIISALSRLTDEINELASGQLKLSGEISRNAKATASLESSVEKLRTGADADREINRGTAQENRDHINKLTHAIRELRERMDSGYSGQPRAELPTLPEIKLELTQEILAKAQVAAEAAVTRHSDARKLKQYNWFHKMFRDGAGAAIKHIVSLILVGIFAWLAHDIFKAPHEHRLEPNPAAEKR